MPSRTIKLNDLKSVEDNKELLLSKGLALSSYNRLKKLLEGGTIFSTRRDLNLHFTPIDTNVLVGIGGFGGGRHRTPASALIFFDPANTTGYTLKLFNSDTQRPFLELLPITGSQLTWNYYQEEVPDEFIVAIKGPDGVLVDLIDQNNKEVKELRFTKKTINRSTIKFKPSKVIKAEENEIVPFNYRGKLISQTPKVNVEGIPIVIFVSSDNNPTADQHFPLCDAVTESNGAFTTSEALFQFDKQFKQITSAFALIGLPKKTQQAIRLIPVQGAKNRLPDKIILIIEGGEVNKKEDCGCSELNFLEKKVLDEFSYHTVVRTSEPMIEAYNITEFDEITAEELLDEKDSDLLDKFPGLAFPRDVVAGFLAKNGKVDKNNFSKLMDLSNLKKVGVTVNKGAPRGRVFLNGKYSIDWDKEPTIYQATSVSHGHLLKFKQLWFNGGYSTGDIIYSLPIEPGKRKQIAVFDWDRKESASNSQQLDFEESLYNSLSRDRDVNEIASSILRESMEGSSHAKTGGIAAGGAIGALGVIPAGEVPIPAGGLLGVAGGEASADSTASQTSSRNATASSMQQLRDLTIQSANALRSQRSTVVQKVEQGERFSTSSEVIANYNHCHAMTIQYFEVLRHFEIQTLLTEVQECLFIPLRIGPFNGDKVLRWREILSRFLIRTDLRIAFAAVERIEQAKDYEAGVDKYYDDLGFPERRFAEERIEYIEGELFIEMEIRRPNDNDKGEYLAEAWSAFSPFLAIQPKEFYDLYIKDQKNKDEAFLRNAGQRIAEEIASKIEIWSYKNSNPILNKKLPLDASLISEFKNKARLCITMRMHGEMPVLRRQDIDFVRIEINSASQSTLLSLIGSSVKIILRSASLRYRTEHLSESLFRDSRVNNDLSTSGDTAQIITPLSKAALVNPRKEDISNYNTLLKHLNDNIEYYHKCIWLRMSPERRFMLLDGIIAPNSGDRSVASVVENRLIGIVGNCLVMPVSPGISIDPKWDKTKNLFEHYFVDPSEPSYLSLPTKGVYAEAILGKCNSCEKIEEDRFWRWNEVPLPDELPAIGQITPPVPAAQQPDLQGRDFPAPMINIQNAPDAPAPQGFGQLVQLLSNPNLFRDITGLSENQKNALASLQRAFQSSEFFGEQAKQLALAANQNAPALEQIRKAKQNNMIDNTKATEAASQEVDNIVKKGKGTGSSASTLIKDIEDLSKLHDQKIITEKEFEQLKNTLRERYKKETERTIDSQEFKDKIVQGDNVEHSKKNGEEKITIRTSPLKTISFAIEVFDYKGNRCLYESGSLNDFQIGDESSDVPLSLSIDGSSMVTLDFDRKATFASLKFAGKFTNSKASTDIIRNGIVLDISNKKSIHLQLKWKSRTIKKTITQGTADGTSLVQSFGLQAAMKFAAAIEYTITGSAQIQEGISSTDTFTVGTEYNFTVPLNEFDIIQVRD